LEGAQKMLGSLLTNAPRGHGPVTDHLHHRPTHNRKCS